MRSRCLWFTLPCLLAVVTPALAQQTGTLSGAVFDTGGRVVPGATITISGDVLPAPRTTVSSDNGLYTFLQLLPGNYTVTVEKTGVGKIAPAGGRRPRARHAARRHSGRAGVRSRRRVGHGPAHRHEIDGSHVQLPPRFHPGSAARTLLPRADSAHPGDCRERRVCAERRRQPAATSTCSTA